MNSLYHQQKKNLDSFKENMDSDEDKVQLETVNSNENIQDERVVADEALPETSPYVMTIEIDKGVSEKLHIFYDSVPEEVAYEFCKKHNLDYTALNYLVEEIKNVLSQNNNEKPEEQEAIIEEKDEESVASEENSKKQRRSEENIDGNKKGDDNNPSRSGKGDLTKNEMSIKEDNLKENLKGETSNAHFNQSTNENNTESYVNTVSNNDQNQRIVNTEPAFKESINDEFKEQVNLKKQHGKGHSKLVKEKDIKAFEQKLFSYQIFLDKYKSTNASYSTLNNSNIHTGKMNKNSSSTVSVFDKLYNDSKQRKQLQVKAAGTKNNVSKEQQRLGKDYLSNILNNKINKHILNQLNNRPVAQPHQNHQHQEKHSSELNYGERLYKKCLSNKEETDNWIAQERKSQYDRNKKIYTFKPNLRRKQDENQSYQVCNTEDNILSRFEYYKKKREDELKELREANEEKCQYNFRPSLNPTSVKIVNYKYQVMNEDSKMQDQPRRDKTQELYELARLKDLHLENLRLQHYGHINFQPAINPPQKEYEEFHTRQKSYSKKKTENQQKKVEEKSINVDKSTGQKLFSPVIRLYRNTANRDSKQIHEHLYSLSFAQREKNRSQNQIVISQILNESRQKLTEENSAQIFIERKLKVYQKLFKLIDSDQDGEISIFCSDFSKIPMRTRKLLSAVILDMKERGTKHNPQSFIQECENLYNALNFEDKRAFLTLPAEEKELTKKRNASTQSLFTFKPEINGRSRVIDSRKTRSQSRLNQTSQSWAERTGKKSL